MQFTATLSSLNYRIWHRLGLASMVCLLACLGLSVQGQTIRYVKPVASGLGNGSSWTNASNNLQAMINVDGVQQVWVAAGTYKPTTDRSRFISFSMKNGVALYGGFNGTETSLDQRVPIDPGANQPSSTTLSGYINPAATDMLTNSYNVIRNTNLNSSARLDGFLITGGNANESLIDPYGNGGGLSNNNSSPTIINCSFQGNYGYRGGGMSNAANSNPIITNCSVSNNVGPSSGMYNESSQPVLINCSFLANRNIGMRNVNSSPVLTNCRFDANINGGIRNENSNPSLTGCSFTNHVSPYGGGLDNYDSAPVLNFCSFENNSASRGGAIYNTNSHPVLTNCRFRRNSANLFGGALCDFSSSSTLINCSFIANSSGLSGGALNTGGNTTITNCSFLNNISTAGGALTMSVPGPNALRNCVLFGNGGIYSMYSDTVIPAKYCLFEPTVGYYSGASNRTTTVSPFVSTTSTELAPCSAAIDAGDPSSTTATSGSTDIAGQPRFYNEGRIDIGAYEYQGSSALTIVQQPVSTSLVNTGTTVMTSIVVSGLSSSYRWFKENLANALTGQTSATLTLSSVQPSDAGSYSAVVTSGCNSLTSSAFSLVVNPAPSPIGFSIIGASVVDCGSVTTAFSRQYRVRIQPQYSGQTGSPVSFSVVNELSSTTQPGPYTLYLWGDKPLITLVAAQAGGPEARYEYRWQADCPAVNGRLGASENLRGLTVRLLGNPVTNQQVRVEVTGGEGQAIELSLFDITGRRLSSEHIEQARAVEQQVLLLNSSWGSTLLLRVSTATQYQTVKVVQGH